MNSHHVVCMVSDFFYPNVGGVEEHIFQLSQYILSIGHKVIVITHCYGDRTGVRFLTGGLKVYHLPIQPFYNQAVLPTFVAGLPLYRYIFVREKVTIVHGHSTFSTMAHEAMATAKILGLKCVFTDHSLFGFADVSAIVTNNFLSLSLADVNHCICVSFVGKENTVLRACVKPEKISVIPNALDTSLFKPDISHRPKNRINVVIISRLQYRKGIDLQPAIIEAICAKYPQVDFLIAGDGPKRSLIEEVRDNVGHHRIKILGSLPHSKVHELLVKGHIFLNTSLTEAFCIAICEAVCSGLQVVSTRVGGIPEVLPSNLILLADPTVQSLIEKMDLAIQKEINGSRIDPYIVHNQMFNLYNWENIARRTVSVYDRISHELPTSFWKSARRYENTGQVFMTFLMALQYLLLYFCVWLWPSNQIDICPDFNTTDSSDCDE